MFASLVRPLTNLRAAANPGTVRRRPLHVLDCAGSMVGANEPQSHLWAAALDARQGDAAAGDRDRLRASLAQVRVASDGIARCIARDLDQFTMHDGTHLDALWPLVDRIAPRRLSLTPAEAWTLGVAIVLHDLGLAVAAYPGGRDELRNARGWPDARAAALRKRLGRAPSAQEVSRADHMLDRAADEAILRARHAERAAELVGVEWSGGHRLLEDCELRHALGATAGRIAASHWWPAERLAELGRLEGAPAGMPTDWTVRPLLLAVLLRVADATHLDALRAPRTERALRCLGSVAQQHWDFQERLRQPTLDGDRLVFTSARPFEADVAGAWWLCAEHLRLLDDELVACDALLQQHRLPRLGARSVTGARDLRELARVIQTDGWEPVDARVQVSDVARLVSRLGGEALYANAPLVPLRELLQNAADAVRARQVLEPEFFGRIVVSIDDELTELVVTDNGVGMTQGVLTGALLDFGRSLWESSELAAELPGLAAAGFEPAGRFGIGFFSVFMWTDKVEVISRPRAGAESDTTVLHLGEGLIGRPLLRRAREDERLSQPGTRVRLELGDKADPFRRALIYHPNPHWHHSIAQQRGSLNDRFARALGWLAPALDVQLQSKVGAQEPHTVIEANDWTTVEATELFERINISTAHLDVMSGHLGLDRYRLVGDPGAPAGRGSLVYPGGAIWGVENRGVLTASGLRVAATSDLCGVLSVDVTDAARQHGATIAPPSAIAAWASEQALLIRQGEWRVTELAAVVMQLGGDPDGLPIARVRSEDLNLEQIESWARDRSRICAIHGAGLRFSSVYDLVDSDALAIYELESRMTAMGGTDRPCREAVRSVVAHAWNVRPEEVLDRDMDLYGVIAFNQTMGAFDHARVKAAEWRRPSQSHR